jgi:hypothetical protein
LLLEPRQHRPHMLAENHLPSILLSVSNIQPETYRHDATDHDAVYSRGGNSSSVESAGMEQDPYMPVNTISPEVYALLAAADASAACCTDAMETSVANLEATLCVSEVHRASDGCRDHPGPLTRMAPPKRFYRTFWLSMSLRLLYRWTQEAKSSIASFVPMVD